MATSSQAPKPTVLTPTEKGVVLDALDAHAKSYERAARAAKDRVIEDAYTAAGASVRTLIAKITVGELEI